jgi:superfamily I DNA and/or RNA helicase
MGAAVCQLPGVEPTNNYTINGIRPKNHFTTAGDLNLMQKSDRKSKDKRQLKRLVSEEVAELVKAADGVFMILTQAGSAWGRAVVNAAEVCAVDEAAAALEVEILPAWEGNTPCILAGDPAQFPPPVFSEGVKDSNENPVNEFTTQLKLPRFKRLDDIAWPCWDQKYQLRMAPGGFEPSNVIFYDGRNQD